MPDDGRSAEVPEVRPEHYKRLAEVRYRIRVFLAFSEAAARAAGLEPQQHQLLLSAKGLPDHLEPTIGTLAERMQLQHHSTVELVDRLEERGFVRRVRDDVDRRRVLVHVTPAGEAVLRELSQHHLAEFRSNGPLLLKALSAVVHDDSEEP
jgi:DNA-binding MarR family transcriptional regulator